MKRAVAVHLGWSAAAAAASIALVPVRSLSKTPDAISVVGAPNDSGGEIFYAQELGLYAKAGLNVHLQALNNPSAVVAGVIAGTVTVGAATVPAIALARERGIPIAIVAPTAIYSSAAPTSGIIVLKNAPYKQAADLNGKTIATRDLANLSFYGAEAWIDKNGGDSKTLKWIEIDDPLTVAAMLAGRCDAASISNPAFSDAINGPDARLFADCYDAIGKRFLIGAHFTTTDYAKSHPDVIRRFCEVMLRTAAWANRHHGESATILEKYIGTPVPPTNTRVTYSERVRSADAQPVLDLLLRYGALKTPMPAAALYVPEVLDM